MTFAHPVSGNFPCPRGCGAMTNNYSHHVCNGSIETRLARIERLLEDLLERRES